MEIMVSILLLAITLTGGIALYHNAEKLMALMVHKKVAMELADERMEEIRNTRYSNLTVGERTENDLTVTGLRASRRTSITEPESMPNLKQVRVRVDWTEAGEQHPKWVELVSYVTD